MLHTIVKELKELCSNKKIWIGILTVLIILIIGTSYHVQKKSQPVGELLKLGVINKDESTYSELLLSYFNSSETFTSFITVVTGEEEEIHKAFQRGELDIYLVIPEDFARNMMNLKHSPITVTINLSDTTKATLFQNILKSYEKYITSVEVNAVGLYELMQKEGFDTELISDTNRNVSIDLIFTALGKESFFQFKPLSQFPVTTLINYYTGSLLVMATLYFGLYIGYQLLRELKQGTLTRLRTTPTPLYQLLTAKIIVNTVLLTAAVLCALLLICRHTFTLELILFSMAIAMFTICFAIFLSTLFQTTQRFVLAGNLIIFYITVIGGGIIPIQFLPQSMLVLSKFTPYYHILKGIIYLNQGQYWRLDGTTAGFFIISLGCMLSAIILLYKRRVMYDEI